MTVPCQAIKKQVAIGSDADVPSLVQSRYSAVLGLNLDHQCKLSSAGSHGFEAASVISERTVGDERDNKGSMEHSRVASVAVLCWQ